MNIVVETFEAGGQEMKMTLINLMVTCVEAVLSRAAHASSRTFTTSP
jgi:hypothetical protein